MDHSLINPNQIRDYGIPLWDNAYDTSQNGELSVELDEAVKVQMKTQWTKILFESTASTKQELHECMEIITSQARKNGTLTKLGQVE